MERFELDTEARDAILAAEVESRYDEGSTANKTAATFVFNEFSLQAAMLIPTQILSRSYDRIMHSKTPQSRLGGLQGRSKNGQV